MRKDTTSTSKILQVWKEIISTSDFPASQQVMESWLLLTKKPLEKTLILLEMVFD